MPEMFDPDPFMFEVPEDANERRLMAAGMEVCRRFIQAGLEGLPTGKVYFCGQVVFDGALARTCYKDMADNIAQIEQFLLTVDPPEQTETLQ
jgi:hypothetical protein